MQGAIPASGRQPFGSRCFPQSSTWRRSFRLVTSLEGGVGVEGESHAGLNRTAVATPQASFVTQRIFRGSRFASGVSEAPRRRTGSSGGNHAAGGSDRGHAVRSRRRLRQPLRRRGR